MNGNKRPSPEAVAEYAKHSAECIACRPRFVYMMVRISKIRPLDIGDCFPSFDDVLNDTEKEWLERIENMLEAIQHITTLGMISKGDA